AAATSLPVGWRGPDPSTWTSSLDADAYRSAVGTIRDHIAAGEVYQANLCRVMSAPMPPDADADPLALARILAAGNPARHAGALRLPAATGRAGTFIASASPELFLSRHGKALLSRPIKGTAATPGGFLPKDTAENVMIVDLVRNDLSAVAATGTVTVPEFLAEEQHPGLVHLVSGVAARVRDGATWADIFAATFPPGSVTGAPKSSALRIIGELEPVPRGPYCGAFGWVDADTCEAELAVAIRTFWLEPGESAPGGTSPRAMMLKFGTGAGITWGSDPDYEWRETELKAARLVALASGQPVTPLT
ncbi:MAG: para-aminobenzoate synthetase component, partial [Actinomycetota bacterium]|nr:para-aminobenzoate synthetase component [Actinomycetota bacterium]